MKKVVVIIFCILISSLTILTDNNNIFLVDSKNLIGILLTVLGLCFSGISFISSSITKIIKRNENSEELLKQSRTIINSVEEDLFLIFKLIVVLVVFNLFIYIDVPFIKDQVNLDFGLFFITSLKQSICNFVFSMCVSLSFYSFYDLIKAAFNLLKNDYK